ncbi:hypothetical protein PoB_007035500 [Plakobranchus ocellatus]|uniref:Uncharacterized protein n=1 Tax=Plakobranchus ocellatus TaxID=259542 RepID=A0AAV4DIN0_9GAST|nr:hypothetical protein PoB_007035500 [Plakobranchus ocellatus]
MVGVLQRIEGGLEKITISKLQETTIRKEAKEMSPGGLNVEINRGDKERVVGQLRIYNKASVTDGRAASSGSCSRCSSGGSRSGQGGRSRRVSLADTVVKELDAKAVAKLSLQYYRPVTPRTMDEVMYIKGMEPRVCT